MARGLDSFCADFSLDSKSSQHLPGHTDTPTWTIISQRGYRSHLQETKVAPRGFVPVKTVKRQQTYHQSWLSLPHLV